MDSNLPAVPPMPEITIVDDATGKELFEPRVNSGPMQLIWNMAAAVQLSKIRQNLEEKNSEGKVVGFNGVNVTSQRQSSQFPKDAQSVELQNYGPSIVFVWINDTAMTPKIIRPGTSHHFAFGNHCVSQIIYECVPGGTALIDIAGQI